MLEATALVKPDRVKYIAECLGAEVPDSASPEEIGRLAYAAAARLLKRVNLPGMAALGIDRQEMLDKVPDEVVMQVDMEIKAFGGIAPPPMPVTRELIAGIAARAYDENN